MRSGWKSTKNKTHKFLKITLVKFAGVIFLYYICIMKQEDLDTITETATGIPVKNLRWLPIDNIITGLVKCPVLGKPNFREGYVSGQWKRNGTPTNTIKGMDELKLEINLEKAI